MQTKLIFLAALCAATFSQAQQSSIVVNPITGATYYSHCANFVTVAVPSLGKDFAPMCRAKGAIIQQSTENPHKFLLKPTGSQCSLLLADEKNFIGELTLKSADAPKPTLQLFVDGQPYDGKSKVKTSSKLSLKVIPNADFLKNFPQDAQYSIASVEFFAKIGDETRNIGGANLSERDAVAGFNVPIPSTDGAWAKGKPITLIFEFKDISRKNYQREVFTETQISDAEKVFFVPLEK